MRKGLEIPTWQNRLQKTVNDFASAYNLLSQDSYRFLVEGIEATKFTTRDLEECTPSFLTLRKPQLKRLLSMSETLGIPLSPVGLITFSSGELNNIRLALEGGFRVQEVGGAYVRSSKFKLGELSRIGMWVGHSPSAGDFTDNEFKRQNEEIEKNAKKKSKNGAVMGLPVPEVPKKIFTPSRTDMKKLDEYTEHEGFHGVHLPLTDNLSSLSDFDACLLSESLAYRTSLILGIRSVDEVRDALINNYFDNLSGEESNKIDNVLATISRSYDASYQGEITWRGILADSIANFVNPDSYLQRFSQQITAYSLNEVMPPFAKKLGI